MDRKGSNVSTSSPRPGIPYPSFSKAHSREAVRSRESVNSNPLTPQHTDVGSNQDSSSAPPRKNSKDATAAAPPSPPTTVGPDLRRATSGSSVRRKATERSGVESNHERSTSDDLAARMKQKSFTASSSSLRHAEEGVHRQSPHASPTKHGSTLRPESPVVRNKRSVENQPKASRVSSQSTIRGSRGDGSRPRSSEVSGSDATLTRSDRSHVRKVPTLDSQGSSPVSDAESTPRTPKTHSSAFSGVNDLKQRGGPGPGIEVLYSDDGTESDGDATAEPTAPPPPPPPPNVVPGKLPQVDYLLENGGLPNLVPKVFASAAHPAPTQRYSQYMSPQVQQFSKADHVQATFHPYSKLLDNYTQVLAKKGSLAVATGYKSVARRLLSRLEETFARDVSSEKCPCVMCKSRPAIPATEDSQGSSWAEVLELVSQRRELPAWPPFHLQSSGDGLGIEDLEFEAPMQKLDIDVPEEYREHYLRQSKKTKQSVQKWLASQPEEEASPPTDVDNETLTFAMLTYLEPDQRRIFTALMRGLAKVPESRTPTPALPTEHKNEFMPKVGIAIQRLYRLPKPPREPEIAMYLLKNPELHSALMTLASVNQTEWDVILSGHFDGFLPGGEEESLGRTPSRGPNATPLSRNGTPFSSVGGVPLSRGTTPFRNGTPGPPGSASNPVAYDEETEIAVLAEVEREIYLGMEALEDAFEQLHVKAEGVRRALRERSAGLSLLAQTRRGSEVEVRMSTPGPGPSGWSQGNGSFTDASGDSETDDGMGDIKSELAPDDSASNIGFREHGRRRERNKRREKEAVRRKTPAVAEEEEPEDDRRSRRRR